MIRETRTAFAGGVSLVALAAVVATTASAQDSGRAYDDDSSRIRPYVIDSARPDETRVPSTSRRTQAARPAPQEDQDEAVPTPRPVVSPAGGSAVRPAARPAPPVNGASMAGSGPCANPNALGVSREVEIDTSAGPRYGFQQYKSHDFLKEGEIVITFDDGPNPAYTKPILQALSHHCTKATFFIVGRNALAHPEIVKDEAARGHTIANHTWSHANLGMRRIVPKRTQQVDAAGMGLPASNMNTGSLSGSAVAATQPLMTPGSIQQQPTFAPALSPDKAKAEIELGFSATSRALGVPMAPFFRFPYLGYSTVMHNYLTERNVAAFSIDVDSVDYRAKRGEDVINKTMKDLAHFKKGILLFHDIQPATAQAMPALLDLLKAKGYRVVHIKPKAHLQTIAAYDARVGKDGGRMDAMVQQKPLVKRTMTWGMTSGGTASAGTASEAVPTTVAARPGDIEAVRRARKPVARTERPERNERQDIPGYVPARGSQPEVLPWLVETRRGG